MFRRGTFSAKKFAKVYLGVSAVGAGFVGGIRALLGTCAAKNIFISL